MLSRGSLLAIFALALAGCQSSHPYSPYQGLSYDYRKPAPASEPSRLAAAAAAAGVPLGVAATPASLSSGSFRDIDPHGGEVGFWNEDPVKKREVAGYPGAYVEWITFRNGGIFVYARLDGGSAAGASDAELLKADLALPAWRQRGIAFDPAQLEKIGPFTYLAQSSPTYNCFVFRGRPLGGGAAQAYGNVCYTKQAKDLAAAKSEMLDILSHVRFAPHEPSHAADAAAVPAPVAVAAPAPPITVSLEQCRHSVSFSGTAIPKDAAPSQAGVIQTGYRYEDGAYSEEATCLCKADFDYSKVSQFDAVDHVKENAEKSEFVLQKASFADGAAGDKELDYEARHNFRNMFLLGRNVYQQCGLYTKAIGTTYADTLRAKKFIGSVTAGTAEKTQSEAAAQPPAAAGAATIAGSTTLPVVSAASGSPAEATPATPRTPVSEAELSPSPKQPADAAPAATAPPPSSAAKSPAVETVSDTRPVEPPAARLKRLQDLYDQKLITQGEYDGKRKAILDTL